MRTRPFPIGAEVYAAAWHPTLDAFFPVQMDHFWGQNEYVVAVCAAYLMLVNAAHALSNHPTDHLAAGPRLAAKEH